MNKLRQIFNGNPDRSAGNVARARTAAIISMSTGILASLHNVRTSPESFILNLALLLVPPTIGFLEVYRQAKIAIGKDAKIS